MPRGNALTRRASANVAAQTRRVVEILDKITANALEDVQGLYLKPGDEGYNTDAEVPWPEAKTKTRVSVEVYKQAMANSREQVRATVALGVVALQGRMKASEWERRAKDVDEEAKKQAVIDVVTEEQKKTPI